MTRNSTTVTAEGRDEGERSGIFIGKQEDARNMLADGLPLEKIVLYTGLSVEDIRALEAAPATV